MADITPGDSISNSAAGTVATVGGITFIFDGTNWVRARSAAGATGTTGTGLLAVAPLLFDGTNYVRQNAGVNVSTDGNTLPSSIIVGLMQSNGTNWDRMRNQYSARTVSAADAAVNTTITTYNLKELSIIIEGSAAFASQNLVIAVSQDNTNFITIDSLNIGTGTSFAKSYSDANKGTTLAVNPMDFPYVKITTPAIGATNTTTTTLGAK